MKTTFAYVCLPLWKPQKESFFLNGSAINIGGGGVKVIPFRKTELF